MKKLLKPLYSVLLISACTLSFTSCEDMLQTDSERYLFEEDNTLNSPNDSIYSSMGILSQLQKIGDRYVLFGELRGDLMTVTENATVSMQQINNFDFTSDNDFASPLDYYSVINNCNFAINRMDTSINVRKEKVMLPEYVAIKGIRAWTYLQIAQIYGKVKYTEKPILDATKASTEYEVLTMDQLVERLIPDLLPYIDVRPLDYGTISNRNSRSFFFPIRFLLGDMYLLQNNYEQAALMYRDLMYNNGYRLNQFYASFWTSSLYTTVTTGHRDAYSNEIITEIPYSNVIQNGHSNLFKWTFHDKCSLAPVSNFVTEMSEAEYYHADIVSNKVSISYREGDLRGLARFNESKTTIGDAFDEVTLANATQANKSAVIITKFRNAGGWNTSIVDPENSLESNVVFPKSISLYRQPQLYLRYAEAVNRLGKPTLAFAVLKYGLNQETLNNADRVNPQELAKKERFLDFSSAIFDSNIGTASRGRGLGVQYVTDFYKIPDYTRTNPAEGQAALNDSINWVEEEILKEMAAETAFEGNRFFDLMRISKHRSVANPTAYLAEKVSAKFTDSASMKAKLLDEKNWYLK